MFSNNKQENNTVHAAGFTPFEKSTLVSFLQISAGRPPGWHLVDDLSGAAVVLLSVTCLEEMDAFVPRLAAWQKVLVVGDSSFGTGWPTVPRPIRLAEIVATLTDVMRPYPEWSSAPSSQAPLDSANAGTADRSVGLDAALAALRRPRAPKGRHNPQRQTA
jgi:hypothetical protein